MALQDFIVSQLSDRAYNRYSDMQNNQLNELRLKAAQAQMDEQQALYEDQQRLRNRLSELQPYYTVDGKRPESFLASIQPAPPPVPLGDIPTNGLSPLGQPQPSTANPSPFVRQEPTTADRLGVMSDEAMRGNAAALPMLSNAINLTEAVAKLKAMGDPQQYYQAQNKIGTYKAYIDDLVNAFKAKGGSALAPLITEQYSKIDPDIATVDTSTMFKTDGETGVVAYPGLGTFIRKPNSDEFHFVPEEKKPNTEFEIFMAEYAPKVGQAQALEMWDKRDTGRKKAGATTISNVVSQKGDTKGVEALVSKLPEYKDQADTAASGINRINKMIGLIDSGAGGSRGFAKATVAPILELVGVSSQGLSDAQLYQRLASSMAGTLRLSVVGPGPVSEYEQKLLKAVTGGGMIGAQAAKELLQYYKEEGQRKIDIFNTTVDAVGTVTPQTAGIYRRATGKSQQPIVNPKSKAGADSLRKKYGIGR